MSSTLAGVLFGLLSALIWGGGDFSGGLASRRIHPFQVTLLASISGVLAMGLIGLLAGETFPDLQGSLWAAAAGVSGALGIAALYRGLSTGSASVVAPTAAVIGAALPVIASIAITGLPVWTQSLGLLVGAAGIWQVSSTSPESRDRVQSIFRQPGLLPAIYAGLAFGGFFIFLAQSESQAVFLPLVVAKLGSLLTAAVLLAVLQLPVPSARRNPVALLAGVLDAGGNLFFLLSARATRLDIAAVVSSMYPVSTILLSAILLKERATRRQWIGLGLCLIALALILS